VNSVSLCLCDGLYVERIDHRDTETQRKIEVRTQPY
jgi:hypothetical protein